MPINLIRDGCTFCELCVLGRAGDPFIIKLRHRDTVNGVKHANLSTDVCESYDQGASRTFTFFADMRTICRKYFVVLM